MMMNQVVYFCAAVAGYLIKKLLCHFLPLGAFSSGWIQTLDISMMSEVVYL
jgi:hypothetical protein